MTSQFVFSLGGIFTLIFCCFTGSPLTGQDRVKFKITHTTVPGNNIRSIIQDNKGFLWVGTQDGLFVFDSKASREFNQDGTLKSGIGGSDVRDVRVSEDEIWITSTQGGLNRINGTTFISEEYISQGKFEGLGNNTIMSIAPFQNKVYTGSEKGLYCYERAKGKIEKLPLPISDRYTLIDKICLYKNYMVIFVRDWGSLVMDINSGKITDSIRLAGNAARQNLRFYSQTNFGNNSWFLGTSDGILSFSVNDRGKLIYNGSIFNGIPQTRTDIFALVTDTSGHLWFSTEGNLFVLDIKKQKCQLVENALESQEDFLNNIYSLYCDKQNNLWLGSQAGLFYLRNSKPFSITYSRSKSSLAKIAHAYYISPQNDSVVFVTAENGLYRVNTNIDLITEIDITQAYDFITKLPDGKILISNSHGLGIMEGKRVTPVQNIYKEFKDFGHCTINSAITLNNHAMVFGTENNNGILIWDFSDHTVSNVTTTSEGMKLDNNTINSVVRIKDNTFCTLTESALLYIDYEKKSIKQLHMQKENSREEYALFFDMCRVRNMFYISSYGNGVIELDTLFRMHRVLSTASGLSNNSVYKLLPWRDSILFMTTNFGLSMMNVVTGKISKLYKSDGLHGNVFEETSGNAYGDIIYAGGINGFTALFPQFINVNNQPPLLYANRVVINLPGSVQIDTSDINAKKVTIPNNAQQTNVYFSGINFSNPERTIFAYKIVGLHKDWISLGNNNFISLLPLHPGTYRLQFKAANEDGIWSEPKELILIFEPKWYQTWWFKLLVLLTVSGIIYAFYRYRIAQIKKQHEIRKNIATDLHDDLGSTLNSVKVFTNLAISGIKQEESLQQIKDNLNEATMGLRDMIWVLDDSLDTVDELVTRLKQYGIPVTAASNMELSIATDFDATKLKLTKEEKRNLFLVCKEVINNAIKYSGASLIRLVIEPAGKKIIIRIADNGSGFDANTVKKGYGLNNMQYRAKQIRYKVELDSSPGNGTAVTISPA